MTIKELYNACEKAIDSGKADLNTQIIIGVSDNRTGLSVTNAQDTELTCDGLIIKAHVDFKW